MENANNLSSSDNRQPSNSSNSIVENNPLPTGSEDLELKEFDWEQEFQDDSTLPTSVPHSVDAQRLPQVRDNAVSEMSDLVEQVENNTCSTQSCQSEAGLTLDETSEQLQATTICDSNVILKLPTTIHLVDGEKGGCGKSFLSRAFIEYCISIGLDTTVVDADISNKDISKIYSGVETAFFSDDEKQAQQADKIFDLAFEKSVIVNLPAQVYTNVTQWIQRNDLIELGKENSITFVKWFVCTGGVDSVNFFLESLEDLGNQMLHVFVRNWGMCDDWKYIDEMPEFIAAKTKYNFTVMDLPKFPFWERNQVDRLGATFEDALAHHELGVVSKQRVKNFLKQAYAAFKETGLVR